MNDILCNDCLDTGWISDREGRTVCNCISETEPYQILLAENEKFRKCCTQRGARMQIMREWMDQQTGLGGPGEWWYFCGERPEAENWFDSDGVPIDA